jgi:hypothetical protein
MPPIPLPILTLESHWMCNACCWKVMLYGAAPLILISAFAHGGDEVLRFKSTNHQTSPMATFNTLHGQSPIDLAYGEPLYLHYEGHCYELRSNS